MIANFVQDHNDGRIAAETSDEFEPILGVNVLATFASIKHEEVEASLGKEKLVGSMHNLLAAKIPDVKLYGLA
jgi:hypothetical protein